MKIVQLKTNNTTYERVGDIVSYHSSCPKLGLENVYKRVGNNTYYRVTCSIFDIEIVCQHTERREAVNQCWDLITRIFKDNKNRLTG